MKKYIPLLLVTMSLIALCGCQRGDGFDFDLIGAYPQPCLLINGTPATSVAPDGAQYVYSPTSKTFCAGTDTMSDYFLVTLSNIPSSEGQKLTASVEYTADSTQKYLTNLSFTVEQIKDNGIVWLWCPASKLSLAIQILN